MAKRSGTSKSRAAGNPKASRSKPATRHVIPEPVEEAIETERERLMRAHSVLVCALRAMDADDLMPIEGPHYPSLIEIACDLIDESIRQLDATHLQTAAAKEEGDEPEKLPYLSGGGYEVREAAPVLWYEKRAANSAIATAICGDAEAATALAATETALPRDQSP